MRLGQNLPAFDELEIVDGVDDEQDHRRAVRSIAVEIFRARSDSHGEHAKEQRRLETSIR